MFNVDILIQKYLYVLKVCIIYDTVYKYDKNSSLFEWFCSNPVNFGQQSNITSRRHDYIFIATQTMYVPSWYAQLCE